MNISETGIVNAGLTMVGATTIANLSDATDRSVEAVKSRILWPLVRGQVLRMHPWKCCGKQASLTQTGTAPLFGFDNSYVLPADYVRMIAMEDSDAEFKEFTGPVLHTDASPANIEYVYLCTDPTKYSDDLVYCLSLVMGYAAAHALGSNVEAADRIMKDLQGFFLPLARMADAAGRGRTRMPATELTDLFDY